MNNGKEATTPAKKAAGGIQTDANGRQYIDCTPTWEGLLPMMLHMCDPRNVQKDKREEVAANMRKEFLRMAQAADAWNAHCKWTEKEAALAGEA